MSRAYRKLLRERDALASTTTPDIKTNDTSEDENDDDGTIVQTQKPSLFALLNAGEDGVADVEEEEDPAEQSDDSPVPELKKPPALRSKKKKKKAKGKSGGSGMEDTKQSREKGKSKASEKRTVDDELDEIDRTLKELNEKFGELPATPAPSVSTGTSKPLLAVDPKALDADAEMRRMFGSKVVNEEIRRKNYIRSGKRTALAVPRENWPKPNKLGLTMETTDGTSYFTFRHSRPYPEIQRAFLICVNTHDPHTIQNLLHNYPYHIDSLLTLSEFAKHSGDVALAAELVERALFAFERSFHSQFNIATGNCRLSYLRHENRAFHLTLFKHIGYIARRGCWRTAFEWVKLLLSLDPEDDPLGTLLSIDFYAISAKEVEWYTRFWDAWSERLMVLPNHAYGIAMATWELESKQGKDHSASSRLLQKAIAYFPSAIVGLYEKCGTSSGDITGHAFFEDHDCPSSLQLLIDLYVERNHALWKVPEVLAWLRENVSAMVRRLNQQDAEVEEGQTLRSTHYSEEIPVPHNVSRHIFISDFPSISAALPPEAVASGIQAHDPLPPENAPPSPYAEYENSPVASGNDPLAAITGLLQNLLPWMRVNGAGNEVADLPEDMRDLEDIADAVLNPPNELIDGEGDEQVAATVRAAQEALPGLFPAPTEDNPNPDWIAGLRDTIARLRLFGWGAAAAQNPAPPGDNDAAEEEDGGAGEDMAEE